MKNAILLFALVGLLLLAGCAQLDSLTNSGGTSGTTTVDYAPSQMSKSSARTGESAFASPAPASISQSQMLIKTANAQVEVPAGTLSDRFTKLKGLVSAQGGQIISADYSESDTSKEYNVQLKIKPESFENLASLLQSLGSVKSMNTNVQDVSDQYVDLQTRIKNLQIQRDELRALFARNGTLEDVLAVENELTRVQTEIEMYQNQQLNMDRQISLSSVTVRLYEQAPAVSSTVLDPLSGVGNIFLGALGFAILIISALLGFGIPVLVALFVLYKLYRHLRPSKPALAQAKSGKK